jgi:hypothetical protein
VFHHCSPLLRRSTCSGTGSSLLMNDFGYETVNEYGDKETDKETDKQRATH